MNGSFLIRAAGRATKTALLAAALATLGAAATPSLAHAGRVEIVTNPAGASCVIRQNGQNLRTVQTPARVKILTFTEGLRVTCRKAGVGEAVYELGKPDERRFSINGDDFESRSAQRRRFARLRRLQRIEIDLITKQARPVSRRTRLF